MRVLDIPVSLDYDSVEALYRPLADAAAAPVLFDARRLRWIDPNGMTALLAAAAVAAQRSGTSPSLSLPANADVTSYLARMGFFREAASLFRAAPGSPRAAGPARESDVLLEITPVATNQDVHAVVNRVQDRAGAILRSLRYADAAVVKFSVILSEVCQNITEHANGRGWVAAQSYNWTKRLGRRVVVIAVSDVGRGFRASLADAHAARFGDLWGDAKALEAAFLEGLTRFPETGRGQGLQQIRKQVKRWDGLVSIRSGTAQIADAPEWTRAPPMADGLAPFPGAQINIMLPERADG